MRTNIAFLLLILFACKPCALQAQDSAPTPIESTGAAVVEASKDSAPPKKKMMPDTPARTMIAALGNKNFEDWQGSLFYEDALNERLFAVFLLLEQGKQDEALELVGAQKEKENEAAQQKEPSVASVQAQQPADTPMFFLSSIMYRGRSDWALWLNGQRLTSRKPSSPDGTIEVVDVSPYAAIFSWAPVQFSRVHNRLIAAVSSEQLPDAKKRANATDIPLKGRVAAKPIEKRLLFMLNNNQTFYTEDNIRFAEGIPYREAAAMTGMSKRAQLNDVTRKHKALGLPATPKSISGAALLTGVMNGVGTTNTGADANTSGIAPPGQQLRYQDINRMLSGNNESGNIPENLLTK